MTATIPAGVETARDLVGPAIAAAVDRLSADVRIVAAYHLGLTDSDGRPVAKGAGGKALRPALAVLSTRAAGAGPGPAAGGPGTAEPLGLALPVGGRAAADRRPGRGPGVRAPR